MSVIRKRYLNNECFAEEFLWVKETPWEISNVSFAHDKRVQQGHEEYTSKTCEHCGQINGKLGGSKTFRCNSCEGSSFGLTLGLELLWDTI
ncbi:15907_t:CDS:2 [Funneliformis caledonium]|uniref:15907_t:CDS:1 n=1 Tax=Funneliformis caledonium TaxID=1117310 RepID=A0A9N9NKJ2_9GLOM|nr:15907_t:CDS:2 [Funneliformis caledonium]